MRIVSHYCVGLMRLLTKSLSQKPQLVYMILGFLTLVMLGLCLDTGYFSII
jgi:hypothetical protein